MDLKNQHVTHKTLGSGVIISQDDKYITVEFASKTSKFPYPNPDTFGKFLSLEDTSIQAAVLKEAEDARIAAEHARAQVEEEKRAAEQACRDAELATRTSGKTFSPAKKVAARIERVPGKAMTFYVFQGDTFDIESSGGFIWAPQHSQSGGRVFHWDNINRSKKAILFSTDAKAMLLPLASQFPIATIAIDQKNLHLRIHGITKDVVPI